MLLYGAPGTGKTEFARALAPALDVALHEVPNQDADGDPISGRARFGAYSVCQNILAHRRQQILLFDATSGGISAQAHKQGENPSAVARLLRTTASRSTLGAVFASQCDNESQPRRPARTEEKV